MTLSYKEINIIIPVLSRIVTGCKIPITKAVQLHRIVNKINEEKVIYNKLYKGIIEKYAEKDEKGQVVLDVRKEPIFKDISKVIEDIAELNSVIIDLGEFEKLKIEDLGDLSLTVAELDSILGKIVKE
jgi:hypothetical protein